jgi:hypothetical protein
MRYRLIPTQGQHASEHLETTDAGCLERFAEALHLDLGMPVLVCEAPEGGLTRALFTVGGDPKQKTRRAR